MSHVSISRSYAILLGLESYVKTRQRGKKIVKALIHGRDMLLSHDELKQREEEHLNKSETVARERRLQEIQSEEDAREENKANIKLLQKLRIRPTTPKHGINGMAKESIEEMPKEEDAVAPGAGPENAIAPEGTKEM
jgi:rubrerythrin